MTAADSESARKFGDPAFYGDHWAATYDEDDGEIDPTAAVDFLAGIAAGGRALELGIGTGRVALPLAGRGVTVEGVDASQAMVERLRAKPGGESIPVTIGDMVDVPVQGQFRLAFLNTSALFSLLDQSRQVDCFRNVARALEPGGVFVVECYVPEVTRYVRGQLVQALAVSEDSVTIEVSRHYAVQQRVTTQFITLDEKGMHVLPVAIRYSWPSELDLMAEIAGLRLQERYSDWKRRPFDSRSRKHISVYQRSLPVWRQVPVARRQGFYS
jgi:SAM-dependent methyltransferase